MKELSIEQKARAYDEAIERAKSLIGDTIIEESGQHIAEVIFPELKESNDEKIRKHLISLVKNWDKDGIASKYTSDANDIKQILAWLEKQSEKLPTGFYYVNSEGEKFYSDTFKYGDVILHVEKQGEKPVIEMKSPEESLGISTKEYNDIVNDCLYGESKSTDNTEPKFKVGDWVVYYRNDSSREVIQVYDIRDGRYYFTDNVHFSWSVKECDEKCHLWSIQDAKNGDILVCNEEILLFKSYSAQDRRISLYCWYNGQTNNFHSKEVVDTLLTTRNKICPATKEQRDLLFKKMHEVGYMWDSKSKQLLSLKAEPSDTLTPAAKWSEEDEKNLSELLSFLLINTSDQWAKYGKWLKSLKERVSSLDSLKMENVDFEKELDEWIKYGPHTNYPWCTIPDAIKITAEHFYELGKTQKGE